MMNVKKELRKRLTEGDDKKTKYPIDINKLIEYAKGIEIVCDGEYGVTYLHEEDNKVFVCLGDSHPFDTEYLESYMLDAIKKSWKVDDDEIDIEIENECGPSGEGWKKFNGKKFV